MFLPVSVKARERRIDFHRLSEHPVECASRPSPLEALEPRARVDASAGERPPFRQLAVLRCEPQERRLRSLPPAAGAAPDGLARHAAGVVSSWTACSTGSATA